MLAHRFHSLTHFRTAFGFRFRSRICTRGTGVRLGLVPNRSDLRLLISREIQFFIQLLQPLFTHFLHSRMITGRGSIGVISRTDPD